MFSVSNVNRGETNRTTTAILVNSKLYKAVTVQLVLSNLNRIDLQADYKQLKKKLKVILVIYYFISQEIDS